MIIDWERDTNFVTKIHINEHSMRDLMMELDLFDLNSQGDANETFSYNR